MALRYDLVIFDLDGTLVDSRLDIANSMNLALGGAGLPAIPDETIASYVGDGVAKLVERCLGRRASDARLAKELLDRYLAFYLDHLADNTRPYPGVRPTIARLGARGVKLAVITNKPFEPSRRILEAVGLLGSIACLLGGDSTPRRKPDPEPLAETLRRLDARAGRALLAGDLPQDVRMGKAGGVATCAVTYGLGHRRDLAALDPDYLIDRFEEIGAIVECQEPGRARE